mgnify:FL=1
MRIRWSDIQESRDLLKVVIAFSMLALSTSNVQAQDIQYKVQTRMPYAEDNNQGIRRELVHQFKKDA